ncbi:unnamed protein product [Caenorhabditis angaria]|uniref:Uncharacterized protein n=1 Tax=Caenorhabditis angaria TaxID=860376 RepID=A0A9P1IN69_9PELO|nr:unnamed protein product [Caenorhabditis angaria]
MSDSKQDDLNVSIDLGSAVKSTTDLIGSAIGLLNASNERSKRKDAQYNTERRDINTSHEASMKDLNNSIVAERATRKHEIESLDGQLKRQEDRRSEQEKLFNERHSNLVERNNSAIRDTNIRHGKELVDFQKDANAQKESLKDRQSTEKTLIVNHHNAFKLEAERSTREFDILSQKRIGEEQQNLDNAREKMIFEKKDLAKMAVENEENHFKQRLELEEKNQAVIQETKSIMNDFENRESELNHVRLDGLSRMLESLSTDETNKINLETFSNLQRGAGEIRNNIFLMAGSIQVSIKSGDDRRFFKAAIKAQLTIEKLQIDIVKLREDLQISSYTLLDENKTEECLTYIEKNCDHLNELVNNEDLKIEYDSENIGKVLKKLLEQSAELVQNIVLKFEIPSENRFLKTTVEANQRLVEKFDSEKSIEASSSRIQPICENTQEYLEKGDQDKKEEKNE